MRPNKYLIFSALMCLAFSAFADGHSHHQDTPDAAIRLDHGKKWKSDLPLRQSMASINDLMRKSVALVRTNAFDDASFSKLGRSITEQTDLIFKNCKLPPEADTELHKILIPILTAEKVLVGKDRTSDKADAFELVLKSLNNYSATFQHDGWIAVH